MIYRSGLHWQRDPTRNLDFIPSMIVFELSIQNLSAKQNHFSIIITSQLFDNQLSRLLFHYVVMNRGATRRGGSSQAYYTSCIKLQLSDCGSRLSRT